MSAHPPTEPRAGGEADAARPRGAGAPPRRRLLRGLGLLLALLAVLLAGVAALPFTSTGSKLVLDLASRLLPGLNATYVDGTLAHGLTLKDVQYGDANQRYAVGRLAGSWRLDWPERELIISRLALHEVEVRLDNRPQQKRTPPPQSLRLPLKFRLQVASIDDLRVEKGEQALRASDIVLSAASNGVQHELKLQRATTPWGLLQATARVDGSGPPTLNAQASLAGQFQSQPLELKLDANGPIERLPVQLDATSLQQQVHAQALLTPFAALPLANARVQATQIDPHAFLPAAPSARLNLKARLEPVPNPPDAELSLKGEFSFTNESPRPFDRQGIALQSGQGQLLASAKQQRISQLELRFPGGGTLQGTIDIAGSDARADLQASHLDLRQLASPLVKTRLEGPVKLASDERGQSLDIDLQGDPVSIRAKVGADKNRIAVEQARLRSGPSVLEISGRLARTETQDYELKGQLRNFDPARFVDLMRIGQDGSQSSPPTIPKGVLLNAELSASGMIKPQIAAHIKLDLHDSQINRLPLTGQADVNWSGMRVRASRVDLASGKNTLSAKGSFGNKGDTLDFTVNAPALGQLGLPLSGSLKADGRLAGSVQEPALQANWQVRGLNAGQLRLERADGSADISGLPWRDPSARTQAQVSISGLRAAPLTLNTMTAKLTGGTDAHALVANLQGRLRDQPLKVGLKASGAVDLKGEQARWHGKLERLDIDSAPRIHLQQAMDVDVAPDLLNLGRATLEVADATLSLERLRWSPQHVASAGAAKRLQPVQLVKLLKQWTGQAPTLEGDLVLDANWDLELDPRAGKGTLQVERRSGDLQFAGPAGPIRTGFSALFARAELRGSDLAIDSRIATARLGELQLRGTIGLLPKEDSFIMPAPASPLDLAAKATVQDLTPVSALAGPSVALEGRLVADVAIRGTLGEPRVSGEVKGDRLALTLFEQGVRLHDGRLRARLSGEVLELDEFILHGGQGTLKANGKMKLTEGDPQLRTDIVADHLQLLADPSRHLTLSGKAVAFNPAGQLRVEGAFTVDRARFSLPEKSAPRLDNDVVIVDRGGPPKDKQASKRDTGEVPGLLPPRIAISVDLGQDFRFKGGGADLRLAGALDLKSGPAQPPQATGTIRVAEGVYEAFGAKLEVERGLITFQGPLDNPSLNMLAMRRGQDVPAGVQVRGTVQRPRVELVSEPPLPEEEKLSWLVFGRGTGNGTGGSAQAQAALQGAALGLVNKFGSAKLGKGLGLSQLSIGSSKYAGLSNQPVVSLGKDLSNRLSIGFEQSLTGVGGVVRLAYELSQHWSVVVLGGTVAGMDLLYSKRFDRWGQKDVAGR